MPDDPGDAPTANSEAGPSLYSRQAISNCSHTRVLWLASASSFFGSCSAGHWLRTYSGDSSPALVLPGCILTYEIAQTLYMGNNIGAFHVESVIHEPLRFGRTILH